MSAWVDHATLGQPGVCRKNSRAGADISHEWPQHQHDHICIPLQHLCRRRPELMAISPAGRGRRGKPPRGRGGGQVWSKSTKLTKSSRSMPGGREGNSARTYRQRCAETGPRRQRTHTTPSSCTPHRTLASSRRFRSGHPGNLSEAEGSSHAKSTWARCLAASCCTCRCSGFSVGCWLSPMYRFASTWWSARYVIGRAFDGGLLVGILAMLTTWSCSSVERLLLQLHDVGLTD